MVSIRVTLVITHGRYFAGGIVKVGVGDTDQVEVSVQALSSDTMSTVDRFIRIPP